MVADPYEILGVQRGASAAEIRRAFRTAAKRAHPDLNPGDKAAEERFKALNQAHDLLSDPDRRARFDRGEIDGAGEPRFQPGAGFPGGHGFQPGAGFSGFAPGGTAEGFDPDTDDLLSFFTRPGRPGGPRRGRDRTYTLDIAFLIAIQGGVQRLSLPDGTSLDVRIPVGLESGQVLRLAGKGTPGPAGGKPGDALVEVFVRPHPHFQREGNDLLLELPVALSELVLGARVSAPTPLGPVSLSVPAGSQNGTRLRLRGRGVPAHAGQPAGDMKVRLKLVLDPADDGLARFLRDRPDAPDFDPRAGFPAPQ